eukprot:scaffold79502_cov19-Prasinocladus_malaysianus.AAC.1
MVSDDGNVDDHRDRDVDRNMDRQMVWGESMVVAFAMGKNFANGHMSTLYIPEPKCTYAYLPDGPE